MKKLFYLMLLLPLLMVACGQKNNQPKGEGDTIRHISVLSVPSKVDSTSLALYQQAVVLLYGDGKNIHPVSADTARMAVALFGQAIEKDSANVLAYNTLVQVYYALGQEQDALATIAAMKQRFPDYPDVNMLHAFLLDVMKQPAEAEVQYREAIAKWDSLMATGGVDVSMEVNRAMAVSMVEGQKKFVGELIKAVRSEKYNVAEREMLEQLINASREPYSRNDVANVTIKGALKVKN